MAHVRKQLREAIAARLTGEGLSVEASRLWPLKPAALPIVLVYVTEEEVTTASMGGAAAPLERRVSVRIEAIVASSEKTDAMLDDIGVRIERGMVTPDRKPGPATWVTLRAVRIAMRAEGEHAFGALVMDYEAVVCTAMNAPDVAL